MPGIILKSLKEQIRSYWILLLSLAMGPFFIFVYYLIVESSKASYDIVFVNNDRGVTLDGKTINYGSHIIDFFSAARPDTFDIPFHTSVAGNIKEGGSLLRDRKADAMIIIPETFSTRLADKTEDSRSPGVPFEITGDLTSINYLISAIWAGELVNEFLLEVTRTQRIAEIKETALGASGHMDDFDMIVPGILILSLIMLMFTASIAFVSEVENKTIMRLKLSRLSAFEFLGGIGIVQSIVGVLSLVLTLITAIALGFEYEGSLFIMLVIATLTSLSIIAFGLIIAAVTKSANEVLIVGNFPMFLFMFFTGAAFPIKSEALFTVAGYPLSAQSLMSPVHAISALNKTLVLNMNFKSILPEIGAILVLTVIYFLAGAVIFNHRHMRLN